MLLTAEPGDVSRRGIPIDILGPISIVVGLASAVTAIVRRPR